MKQKQKKLQMKILRMLQPGGTYMCPIACPGVDENNVDIGFTELNMDVAAATPGTYSYESSLGASTNNSITTSISVTNTGEKMESDVVINILGEDIDKIVDTVVFASPYVTG